MKNLGVVFYQIPRRKVELVRRFDPYLALLEVGLHGRYRRPCAIGEEATSRIVEAPAHLPQLIVKAR